MKKNRLFYVGNLLAYKITLIIIAINTLFLIMTLNNMKLGAYVGIYILFNIGFTLLLFLLAVKVKIYDRKWINLLLIIAIFYLLRIPLINGTINNSLKHATLISYVCSSVLLSWSYITSRKKINIREKEING